MLPTLWLFKSHITLQDLRVLANWRALIRCGMAIPVVVRDDAIYQDPETLLSSQEKTMSRLQEYPARLADSKLDEQLTWEKRS